MLYIYIYTQYTGIDGHFLSFLHIQQILTNYKQVLRLASQAACYPDPAQLASQAETISELSVHRDLLLKQQSEDRARWSAERETWARTAEALLIKRREEINSSDKEHVYHFPHLCCSLV